MPASDGVARWSADTRPDLRRELRAAARCRARRRGAAAAARSAAAASRIRRDWSAVNTPSSQNTSQNRAAPWAATAGQLLVDDAAGRRPRCRPAGRGTRAGRRGRRATSGRRRSGPRGRAGGRPRAAAARSRGRARSRTSPRSSSSPWPSISSSQRRPWSARSSVARRPRRRDGREDPAARGEDLEVAGAALAELELALAAAGEEQVGVRVDEARA